MSRHLSNGDGAGHQNRPSESQPTADNRPKRSLLRRILGSADLKLALFILACLGVIALLVRVLYWMGPADYGTIDVARQKEATSVVTEIGTGGPSVPIVPGGEPYFPMPVGGSMENIYAYDMSQVEVVDHQEIDEWEMGPGASPLDDSGWQTYCDMLWALRQGKRSFMLQDASETSVAAAWEGINVDHSAMIGWLWTATPYWYGHGVTIDEHLGLTGTDILSDGRDAGDADLGRRDVPLDLGGEGRVLVTVDAGVSDEEIDGWQREMDAAYDDYAGWFGEENDSEYERAIHAYEHVINVCGLARAGEDDLGDDPSGGRSARSALVGKRATSVGYANAVTYMLRKSGLSCWTVWGSRSGSEHAWNVACVEGTWFHLDATAGDLGNSTSESDHIRKFDYSRFGMTDADLAIAKYEVNHPEWYPTCNSDRWNWFVVNDRRFDTFDADALVSLSRDYLDKGWDNLSVQYANQEAYDEAQDRVSNLSIDRRGHANLWFRADPVLRTVTIVWG